MFDQIKTPTDSLYKFVSVFGILLFGVSAWWSIENTKYQNQLSIEIGLMEFADEMDDMLADRQDISAVEMIGRLRKGERHKLSKLSTFTDTRAPEDWKIVSEYLNSLDETDLQDEAKCKEIQGELVRFLVTPEQRLRIVENKQALLKLKVLEEHGREWRRTGPVWGMLLGIAVSLLGFVLWYFFSQQYDDRLKRAETELAEIELQTQRLKNIGFEVVVRNVSNQEEKCDEESICPETEEKEIPADCTNPNEIDDGPDADDEPMASTT